jgi:RNA polymerase sigma-70 factor (ECF subfamily)
VALNRAVSLSMVAGPQTALAEIEKLERDARLSGYQYLPAIKADLLSRLGRTGEAAAAYRQAFALATNEAERAFLAEQIAVHTPSTREHKRQTAPQPPRAGQDRRLPFSPPWSEPGS